MRLLDAIADWLLHVLQARAQLRLGVALCLLSVPIYAWTPFSGEPVMIYLMSAAAITLTGVSIVISAEVLEQGEDGDDGPPS